MKIALFLTAFALMIGTAAANPPKKSMKLTPPQPAPALSATDVFGKPVSLTDLRGKKVMISFMRFASCPICNFRVHEIMTHYDSLTAQNFVFIAVYESSPEILTQYLTDEKIPFPIISDVSNKWYAAYGVERSMGKFLKAMFSTASMKALKAGGKMYAKKPRKDGNMDRIGADFLINPDGTLAKAYYGSFVGDHLPMTEVAAFARGN